MTDPTPTSNNTDLEKAVAEITTDFREGVWNPRPLEVNELTVDEKILALIKKETDKARVGELERLIPDHSKKGTRGHYIHLSNKDISDRIAELASININKENR